MQWKSQWNDMQWNGMNEWNEMEWNEMQSYESTWNECNDMEIELNGN